MKLRKPALILHGYAGVIAGILLIIIGLTGSVLVFSEELDHFLNPQLLQVVPQDERVPLETVLNTVREARPELKAHRVIVPQKPDGVYTVMMESPSEEYTNVYVNPYSGTILGSRPFKQTLGGFLIELHLNLFAGDLGAKVVGLSGLLLLLLGITGVILWPGWKRLTPGFKVRWKSPSRLVNYDIHKVVGISSLIFLTTLGFTGAAMTFYETAAPVINWIARTPPLPDPPTSQPVADTTPITIDEVLRKADAALPGAETTKIFPAKTSEAAVNVWKKFPQDAQPYGSSYVYLDQYNGTVLQLENSFKAPINTQIWNQIYLLHVGTYGGLITRVLYVLIGLTPIVLFITGLVLWRQRQWHKAHRKEAIRQVEQQQT